jgi:integrase
MISTSSTSNTRSCGLTEWAYLRDLANLTSAATFRSHQTVVLKFASWYQNDDQDTHGLNAETIATFLIDMTEETDISTSTVRGYLDVLSNLVAYHQSDDPDVVRARILNKGRLSQNGPNFDRSAYNLDDETQEAVETLLSTLRSRKFGLRLHAFAETIIASRGPPKQVRLLNLGDIDTDESEAKIGLSDKSVVGEAGLVTNRSVDLSHEAVEALRSYLNYERLSPNGGEDPLFTTKRGRVASSTLRRSIKAASETALTQSCSDFGGNELLTETERNPQHVTLIDIWHYALTKGGQDDD